jgi:hypothetical protein
MAIQKIGGLWRPKQSKNPDVVASGYIWAPGKVRIIVMKPGKYGSGKAQHPPDLLIFATADDEPSQGQSSGGDILGGPEPQDDVPF